MRLEGTARIGRHPDVESLWRRAGVRFSRTTSVHERAAAFIEDYVVSERGENAQLFCFAT